MRIGTKSVLFGAHQFAIHPWFVALGWWKLYGFPFDPRLWVAFFVHDLGYIGKPNMDGPEGETHVLLGARIMQRLFGWMEKRKDWSHVGVTMPDGSRLWLGPWAQFSLFHSRFYAKMHDMPFSRLCVADKLAICLTPRWLYLPMVRWTGEIAEYMQLAKSRNCAGEPNSKYESMQMATNSEVAWHQAMTGYVRRWVEEHRDGRQDTWTPKVREAADANGVYR